MTDPGWGREYGSPFVTEQGEARHLFRKGSHCRWYTEAGVQDGPEQRNVVPALIWAWAQGWADPTTPAWLTAAVRSEIAANTRTRR